MKIDDVQHRGFDQLGFRQRSFDSQHRFVGKHELPFPHRADRSREAERSQIIEVFVRITVFLQKCQVAVRKAEILEITDKALQPGKHRIAVLKRNFPEIHFEYRLAVVNSVLPIHLGHVDLVFVRMQRQAVIRVKRFGRSNRLICHGQHPPLCEFEK